MVKLQNSNTNLPKNIYNEDKCYVLFVKCTTNTFNNKRAGVTNYLCNVSIVYERKTCHLNINRNKLVMKIRYLCKY